MTQLIPRRSALTDGDAAGALQLETLRDLQAAFSSSPDYRLAQNAITRNNLDDVALNHRVAFTDDHTFSVSLDDWAVTDQKQTGRCWLFAGLNLLRFAARRVLGVKEFEFSQNYLMFWDKIERANYFFEAILESADSDVDERAVAFLKSRTLSPTALPSIGSFPGPKITSTITTITMRCHGCRTPTPMFDISRPRLYMLVTQNKKRSPGEPGA